MHPSPLVSIIISARNEAPVIETLLRSLRAQTYPRLEVILVDNFSTDPTAALAQPYVHKLIQAGPERSAQRNIGAKAATGQLLVFLDADMRLEPGVAAAAVSLFEAQPGALFACIPERSVGHNFWARAKALERNCYVDEPSVMAARIFERDFFLRLGGFDEALTGPEDWDLTQRARAQAAMLILNEFLWHDEGRLTLREQMRKKFYYARSYAQYARKHPQLAQAQANLLFRPAYLRHWRELARQPVLTLGFLTLRLLEGVAGLAGIAHQNRLSRRAERLNEAADRT
jgi:glycosyltransferase involved in cell wall biosynthesis